MEFKGTKGEWLLHESYVLEKKMICIASTKNMSPIRNNYPLVCAISEVNGYSEEDKANAKLIASAPDLMESLNDLLEQLENEHLSEYAEEYITKGEQAINRALK